MKEDTEEEMAPLINLSTIDVEDIDCGQKTDLNATEWA